MWRLLSFWVRAPVHAIEGEEEESWVCILSFYAFRCTYKTTTMPSTCSLHWDKHPHSSLIGCRGVTKLSSVKVIPYNNKPSGNSYCNNKTCWKGLSSSNLGLFPPWNKAHTHRHTHRFQFVRVFGRLHRQDRVTVLVWWRFGDPCEAESVLCQKDKEQILTTHVKTSRCLAASRLHASWHSVHVVNL